MLPPNGSWVPCEGSGHRRGQASHRSEEVRRVVCALEAARFETDRRSYWNPPDSQGGGPSRERIEEGNAPYLARAGVPLRATARLSPLRAGRPLGMAFLSCPTPFSTAGAKPRNTCASVVAARPPSPGAALRRRRASRPRCPAVACATSPSAKDGEDPAPEGEDVIERAVRFLFGKKQAEPFGLKRFDRDRFPELYQATLDEFADPVDGDTDEISLFRPLLARTQLQERSLQLMYDAERDGWSANVFHALVDRKGASVGFMGTAGATFGFYNPKGWCGYGESRGSLAAFLFTWQDNDLSRVPVKLRKIGRGALACLDDPDCGPKMGADALVVPLRPPRATWDDLPEDRIARSKVRPAATRCVAVDPLLDSLPSAAHWGGYSCCSVDFGQLGSYFERLTVGNNRNCLFAAGEDGKGEQLRFLRIYSGVYAEGEGSLPLPPSLSRSSLRFSRVLTQGLPLRPALLPSPFCWWRRNSLQRCPAIFSRVGPRADDGRRDVYVSRALEATANWSCA
jgi:TLD